MGMLRILSEASLKRVPIACHGSEKRRVAHVAVTPFHLPRAALIADLPWETIFSRIDITVFTKKQYKRNQSLCCNVLFSSFFIAMFFGSQNAVNVSPF